MAALCSGRLTGRGAGLREFESSASLLNRRFHAEDWLIGSKVTYADFRVVCVLPFADLRYMRGGAAVSPCG